MGSRKDRWLFLLFCSVLGAQQQHPPLFRRSVAIRVSYSRIVFRARWPTRFSRSQRRRRPLLRRCGTAKWTGCCSATRVASRTRSFCRAKVPRGSMKLFPSMYLCHTHTHSLSLCLSVCHYLCLSVCHYLLLVLDRGSLQVWKMHLHHRLIAVCVVVLNIRMPVLWCILTRSRSAPQADRDRLSLSGDQCSHARRGQLRYGQGGVRDLGG
jgi:hypothetical protein